MLMTTAIGGIISGVGGAVSKSLSVVGKGVSGVSLLLGVITAAFGGYLGKPSVYETTRTDRS